MSQNEKEIAKSNPAASSLSVVLGTPSTLPGESEEEYQTGLQALIEELDAKTVMQVYLAEKIFECLWWIRRYEQQKRATLAAEMATLLLERPRHIRRTPAECLAMDIVLDPGRREEFEELLELASYTEQSLMQAAFSNTQIAIDKLNTQVTMLAKTFAGFQASYEVLVNRKFHIERLRLQNELLVKDLSAIEMEALPDAGQPKKTRRKQA